MEHNKRERNGGTETETGIETETQKHQTNSYKNRMQWAKANGIQDYTPSSALFTYTIEWIVVGIVILFVHGARGSAMSVCKYFCAV